MKDINIELLDIKKIAEKTKFEVVRGKLEAKICF